MIVDLKNEEGYVYAYFEWELVNDKGEFKNDGEYMHVRSLWVHSKYSGYKCIKHFISIVHNDPRNKTMKWIYWLRDNKRLSKTFSREKASKKGRLIC